MEIDVRKIAKLSMLQIPEEKIPSFEKEMGRIVEMVEKLPDIQGVGTLLDPNNQMQLREDEIVPSTPRDELLENVPQKIAGCIVVPKTVEE